MRPQPPDHEHRDAARLKLDHNAVVEAGAGTGKTTLLTDRLLFLLLGRGVPVGSLVALTFTEKAAAEIKLRLNDRLLEVLKGGDAAPPELSAVFKQSADTVAQRARAALEDMDKAQIGTIHSFCSHLLRLYPVQAGVDPSFAVDEGDAFEDLFSAEWARFLDVELGEKAPRAAAWIELLRRVDLAHVEELAKALCDEGLDPAAAGRPDPASAQWLRLQAAALSGLAAVQTGKLSGNSRFPESLQSVLARLEAAAAAAEQDMPPLEGSEPQVIASTWPSKWDEAGAPVYKETLKLAQSCSASSEALVRRACLLARPFAESFRSLYTNRGLISFQGLLRKARDLVRDNLEAREELKARYQAMLIDEFQDTDPLQGELFLFLAEVPGGKAPRWQDVKLGPGRLFVVGDPKQSIYRFRGADIAAFQGFTKRLLEGGKSMACDLTANFRSHEGVIGPVNGIFEKVMAYEAGSQPRYKAIQPQGKPEQDAWRGVAVEPADGKKLEAAQGRRTEAAWVARWIEENCGEGKPWRYRDVAVLMRSSRPLGALLEAFKTRGIVYAVETERFFYEAPEVQDMLNLLRALDDTGDRLSLAGLLRSPLVAVHDRDLMKLAESNELSYLKRPKHGPKRVGELYERLRGLRERVGRVPVGELVGAALSETKLLETAASVYHGQQTMANLLKFARMASEASDARDRGLTLKEFIDRMSTAVRDTEREGESPLADDNFDAVRVLTIHKSKGLEFPVVFVVDLSAKISAGGRKKQLLVDWQEAKAGVSLGGLNGASYVRVEAREKARQKDETLRLLYVALTRAKRRMFLLGGAKPADSGALSNWLIKAGAWPPKESVREGEGIVENAGGPAALKPAHPLPPSEDLEALWNERVKRKEKAEGKRWTTSATAALEEQPHQPALEEGELAPGGAEPALVGQACHAALELWDFKGPLDAAAACRRLKHLKPLADWEAVEAEASRRLGAFAASKEGRALAKLELVGREVPFVYGEDGAVVRGTIDLLARENGKLVVIDYKTGKKADYAAQGAIYKEAVKRALGEDCEFRLVYLA